VEYCFLQEDWTKAKYYCKWLGMELVSIESEEENLAIIAALGKLSLGATTHKQLWLKVIFLLLFKFNPVKRMSECNFS